MPTTSGLSATDAATTLAEVRRVRATIRRECLDSLFGGVWFVAILIGLATLGSLAELVPLGDRTTNGGQLAYGLYWSAAGVACLAFVWRRTRLQPVAWRVPANLVLAACVFAMAFGAVFFSKLSHNHPYLSPALFTAAFLLVAAVQARVAIGATALILGAALGVASLTDAMSNGRSGPVLVYGAAFLVAGALFRLLERRA